MKLAIILISLMLSSQAMAEDLTMRLGNLSYFDGFKTSKQVVSIKNNTATTIPYVDVECGFLSGDRLVAAGHFAATKLVPGSTAYITVPSSEAIPEPDHADCRIVVR